MLPHLIRALLVSLPLAPVALAQDQLWIEQDGTVEDENVRAMAPDGAGGAFVVGATKGDLGAPNAGKWDAWIGRRDAAGNPQWIRQIGSADTDRALAAAPDGQGGVFVAGETLGSLAGPQLGPVDAWIARYDGAGNQLWILQIGTTGFESAMALASDGSGGVFVSGYTSGDFGGPHLGSEDCWLARYDSAGSQLWITKFGTISWELCMGAASDDTGGVFLCGVTYGDLGGSSTGAKDAWIVRYDGAGTQLWAEQFGSSAHDWAEALAPDGAGGLIVGGITEDDLFGQHVGAEDIWVARYDAAGKKVWSDHYGTTSTDLVFGAAADGAGGGYIAGLTYGELNGGKNKGGSEAWAMRFGSAGALLWSHQFGTPLNDYLLAAKSDGVGGMFVGGWTKGNMGAINAGGFDAWIARYSGLLFNNYCSPAQSNSTGHPAKIEGIGDSFALANNLTLRAYQLPHDQWGFFLTSMTQGFVASPGGSQGNLCLAGGIGRYNPKSGYSILNSGASGKFELVLDLANTPTPSGSVGVIAGQTWNFQAWYRDQNPGQTSNFTDAVSVLFL